MEMKKYMTPEMEVVEIKIQATLLAGSFDDGGEEYQPGEGGGQQPL